MWLTHELCFHICYGNRVKCEADATVGLFLSILSAHTPINYALCVMLGLCYIGTFVAVLFCCFPQALHVS